MTTQTTSHVVEVNEVVVFATGRGADWWAWFLMAHRTPSTTAITAGTTRTMPHHRRLQPTLHRWP